MPERPRFLLELLPLLKRVRRLALTLPGPHLRGLATIPPDALWTLEDLSLTYDHENTPLPTPPRLSTSAPLSLGDCPNHRRLSIQSLGSNLRFLAGGFLEKTP